ncbi:serine/threonine-protein kinase [Embleya sp. NPDC055664]|uniref:serine/threonine-protein kinase n=1 Tax=Embleya sp. NPDC020630 TaxID=3363979 RepID=UPI00378A2110
MKRKIGEGAEGEIFVAWDEGFKRDVAIKFQRAQTFESPETYVDDGRLIEQEYDRLGVVLDVPGIPRVFDKGSFGISNRRFLVMELIDGVTVASWISAHQPVPAAAALSAIGQLCEILGGLHAKEYVHRDVTPNNTMLQPDGRVRLLDVGISVMAGELNAYPGGSPGYAAPEQYDRTVALTPQADVFALGVLLFEMVAARLPYSGLERPLDDRASAFPKDFRAEMPETLRSLGLAMVSVDPRERPNGVAEVLRLLQPMLPAAGSPASPKATRPDPTAPYRLGLAVP